jgi:hypothetical protein
MSHHTTIYVSSYYDYTDAWGKVLLHTKLFAELTFFQRMLTYADVC